MEVMRFWIRLAAAFAVMCLSALVSAPGPQAISVAERHKLTDPTLLSVEEREHSEATLTDASQLYRICHSRPQRVIPTHGPKTERTPNHTTAMTRHHIVKPLFSFYDGRCRQETAPFRASSQCAYYIIALRRIIR